MTMFNKLTKTLLVASGILLATTCIAGAEYIDSVNYNYDSQKVEISGKDFEKYEGSVATVLLLKNGMTLENYKPGTADDDNVEKQTQVVIKDGKFNIDFSLNTPADKAKYTAYVKAGSILKSTSFTYYKDITSVYDAAVGANTDGDFMWVVYNNRAKLGLTETTFVKLSDEGQLMTGMLAFADKAAMIKEANGDKEKGFELLKEAARRAAYVVALNENKLDEVVTDGKFNEPEVLGLTGLKETAYELFSENTTDTGVEKVLKNIVSKNYESVNAFYKGFVYEATIAAIKYNKESGTAHIRGALNNNNSMNEFNLINYNKVSTNDIDLLLLNGSEWDKDDIQSILNTPVDKGTGNKNPGDKDGNGSSAPVGGYSQPYNIGGSTPPTPPTPTDTFKDLDTVEWAKAAIESLADKGVVSGRGDGTYAPLDNVTRAEFITLIVKALGLTAEGATCEFDDVKTDSWYYETVSIGTTLGIASGYGNGKFGATDMITRQDAAVMLDNAIQKSGNALESKNDGIDFADKAEISDYAASSVDTLVKAGILSGADGSFMPKNNATRAEAAVMLSQIMDALGLEG